MKSVVRIESEGKVKDVGLRELATVPAAEDVDSKVALIQALIPLGLKAVAEGVKKVSGSQEPFSVRRVLPHPGLLQTRI
jgi:hypothetical protein